MKAITLWQPWASLCVIPRPIDPATFSTFGGAIPLPFKTIETRSWPAPKSLIGQRIAIHAAKRKPLSIYAADMVAIDGNGVVVVPRHEADGIGFTWPRKDPAASTLAQYAQRRAASLQNQGSGH